MLREGALNDPRRARRGLCGMSCQAQRWDGACRPSPLHGWNANTGNVLVKFRLSTHSRSRERLCKTSKADSDHFRPAASAVNLHARAGLPPPNVRAAVEDHSNFNERTSKSQALDWFSGRVRSTYESMVINKGILSTFSTSSGIVLRCTASGSRVRLASISKSVQ